MQNHTAAYDQLTIYQNDITLTGNPNRQTLKQNFDLCLYESFVSLSALKDGERTFKMKTVTPQISQDLFPSHKSCNIISAITTTAGGSDLIWKKKKKKPKNPNVFCFCTYFSLHYSSKQILQHLPKWSCSNSLAQILL